MPRRRRLGTGDCPPETSETWGLERANRITGDCYDANGNLLAESAPPCPSPTYVYDAENHMVSYSTAAYTYDGNGLRVKKVSGSTTTVYIFSGSKVIAEYDNGAAVGSPSREYIYAGTALLAKVDSSGTKYYHQDHLSNRLVTDSSGNKVAEMGHFPYGESWYNASGDKLIFTTYERDSESGNDYAQARYNMSRLGRFSSPDPIPGSTSDPQSLNRYSYVRNIPVMLTDPSGLCAAVSQNRDTGESQDAKGSGPFSMGSDSMGEPDPQGGTVCLDGGDITANPGEPGFAIGGGGGLGLMLIPVYGYSWQTETDGPWDDQFTTGEWTYGLLGFSFFAPGGDPGGPTDGGWKDDPKNLVLKVTKDCFNKAQGQRETDYTLATSSGAAVQGNYNITEQLSDTSLAPPWGQSSNHPELGVDEINQFHDAIRPALYSSGSSVGVQYFLVSPGGLGNAQWVPISRPGQDTVRFNKIEIQGAPNPASNIIKVNGRIAPPC